MKNTQWTACPGNRGHVQSAVPGATTCTQISKTQWTACLILLALCAMIASCNGPQYASEQAGYAAAAPEAAAEPLRAAGKRKAAVMNRARAELAADEARGVQTDGAFAALAGTQVDRYLIKNASIAVEVEDPKVALEALVASVKQAGGYVADMQEQTDLLGARHVTLQARIPSDKFEEALQQMEGLGKVLNQRVSSDDVTEEFVDTDARVRNLKRTEERLLDHLNRSAKLQDILGVERELTRVRGEIERHEGRLKFLAHRVAFSTIAIQLHEKAKAQPIVPGATFSTANEASAAMRSLVAFAQRQWVRIIWLGIWAVVWVPIAVVALFILRKILRARRQTDA